LIKFGQNSAIHFKEITRMKILFGIPDYTHRELVNLEIDGIRALIPNCHTIHYGPVYSKKGFINKFFTTITNSYSIKKAIINNKYDLLFLNTAFDFNAIVRDCITLFILKPLKTKFFLKFHGTDIFLLDNLGWYKKMLVNWLLNTAHGVGVLSSEEKNAFLRIGYSEQKVFVVKNPVNPALYVKGINFKKKMGIADPTFVFIFCGRFLAFKGMMDVLKALKIVVPEFQHTHLFCIGDGPEMSKAQKFVTQNDLESFVTFTGFISEIEIRNFYTNADALVFPSSHEGFPMVVFQSLAAGIPIITTRITAAADYLDEPDNVLWVEPNNPVQLAESMIKLLTDDNLVKKMRNNNLLKCQKFTTDKNAPEYFSIFEKLINK
jgi:glycosyltransferase involved in cell wall biosynthesis